jgi:hypothetical protein
MVIALRATSGLLAARSRMACHASAQRSLRRVPPGNAVWLTSVVPPGAERKTPTIREKTAGGIQLMVAVAAVAFGVTLIAQASTVVRT